MSIALYQGNHPKDLHNTGHAGLFFQKFFNGFNPQFTDFSDKENAKRDFLKKFEGGQGNTEALQQACLRQIELVEKLSGQWFVVSTTEASPFITGLGNLHPVENGFLWHHTLGTPYMQGSAIKGILRSWLEIHLGYGAPDSGDAQQDLVDLQRYFGSDHKDPKQQKLDQQAGQLVFFDAIPIDRPMLKAEVMTPHMGNYYAQGRKNPGQADTLPADWHSPTPIPFLVVDKASFLISFAPRMTLPTQDKQKISEELSGLATALKNALAQMGAGAKTATGFGRLVLNSKETERLSKVKKESSMSEVLKQVQTLKEQYLADKKEAGKQSASDVWNFLTEAVKDLSSFSNEEITAIRELVKEYQPSKKKEKDFKSLIKQPINEHK